MPAPLLPRDPEQTPVIVACCRTAIGRSHADRGLFRGVRGDELASAAVTAAVARSGIDPASVEDLLVGATQQRGELGGNVARAVALMAGLPLATAGVTVNRLCGSGLEALLQASRAVVEGSAATQVVAGVEHMHHEPMEQGVDFHPRVVARSSRGVLSMGLTAEHLASSRGITRRRQEEYALGSHARAAAAADTGAFAAEIVPVLGLDEAGRLVEATADQSVRRDTSLEAMGRLEPAFLPGLGTVTAATSAPLSDGAAAAVVTSLAAARRQGLTALARIVAGAVVGVPPAEMGTGPVAATRKLLGRLGVGVEAIDLVELNEAFAAQTLCCIDELGLDPARVNVRGGALAIGHPLGASGVRIVTTLLHAMRDRGDRLGLATMCIGLGQGIAMLVERIEP